MRDPEYIDSILDEIRKAWKAHPDLRFYQLLLNTMPSDIWCRNQLYYRGDGWIVKDLHITYGPDLTQNAP